MMYTASCANLSCSLGIYQSTVPPFYQAGKINKTSGRATEWKKSTALLPDPEMYPGFQIMGSSGPLLEKFGGPLLSFGGPADL